MDKAAKSETRWVIVGNVGLYNGSWFTRREAISEHVAGYVISDVISDDPIALWKWRRECGDRAVRATITWEA